MHVSDFMCERVGGTVSDVAETVSGSGGKKKSAGV